MNLGNEFFFYLFYNQCVLFEVMSIKSITIACGVLPRLNGVVTLDAGNLEASGKAKHFMNNLIDKTPLFLITAKKNQTLFIFITINLTPLCGVFFGRRNHQKQHGSVFWARHDIKI